MCRRVFSYIAVLSCTLAASGARAHHSYSEYDDKQIVEIEGTLVKVTMQNPHIHFFVEVVGADGRAVTVDLESTSLNWLQRTNVPPELLRTGSRVKFAGWPSKRSPDRMYSLNMLAADGEEILLFRTAKPRWASATLGFGSDESQSFFQGGVASDTDTLFRVWASHLGAPGAALAPTAPLALTESAKRAAATFDSVKHSVVSCTPKGMPLLMSQPPPMEFVDRGDTILLRMEEYETVRTIHMTTPVGIDAQPRSPLGFSVGSWDGKTLVVETSRLDSPYLNSSGVPLGANARFVERFTPAADGSRLDYTLTITDPDSLTAPAELKRYWVWRPGEQVLPFKCVEE